jgi:peptide/nickel transport system substrate-binding protein
MFSRASKLRFRRSVRMRQRQVTNIGEEAEIQLDQHFFHRLDRLIPVRRFVLSWLLLVLLLISGVLVQTFGLPSYYQKLMPAPGGVYTEGVVGEFTNANPIYATSAADKTVSELVFSGLLAYDVHNELVGDLAESWQSDDRGQVYTVKLRQNVKWHDGQSFTSKDVVFTYGAIQNADAQSPLRASWQGVKVEAVDAYTVQFTLTNPLASFIYGMTNGILPEHILRDVSPADMRTVLFNTAKPVGTGPFMWQAIEVTVNSTSAREVQIALARYKDYHQGAPKLDGFTVRVFQDQAQMLVALNKRELTAVAGLIWPPDSLPEGTVTENFTQTAAMMAFFKTTEGVLKDKTIRQALVKSVDVSGIRKKLGYSALAVDSPLLRGQIGYDRAITQFAYNIESANAILDAAGWVRGTDGIRSKDGVVLAFSLTSERNKETTAVSKALQEQWRAMGADVSLRLQSGNEFQETQSLHSYEVLLRGISIGLDPDVFVFWHSSQASVLSGSRLNFSEYTSTTADASLEAARTRLDPNLRVQKYKPFLQAWSEDAPAVAIYQPRSMYIVRGNVAGLRAHNVNSATDRFANVNEWMIRRVKTTVE